jgi:hypothetical protein
MTHLIRTNERREVRRALSLECQVVREKDFRLVSNETLDLSPAGMLVPTEVDLEPGEGVLVSFRATDLGLWFDTEATVARIIHGRRPGDKGRGVGLRFSTLSNVKRLILRGHLRRIPPPLPRREQRIAWAATVKGLQADRLASPWMDAEPSAPLPMQTPHGVEASPAPHQNVDPASILGAMFRAWGALGTG